MMRWTLPILLAAVVAAPGNALADGKSDGLTYLVPEMNGAGFHLQDGKRPYLHRLSFSPAFGELGDAKYYVFRLAYNPNRWLGYEANLGHNPAASVHALVNSLRVLLRVPLPGRFQPFVSADYGMMLVFPGKVFQADPVTKNLVGAGLGLETYIRDDVAIRGEIRDVTVLGGRTESDESAAFSYREFTFGFSFYKTLNR
jgi:hypothetical protein